MGYLQSALNVLRNIPKISRNSTRDIFQINFFRNDENTWEKCPHGDFTSICDTFTCWLSKRFLKQRFLESALTKIFTVCNFGNTLAIAIIFFFSKCLRFNLDCRNGTKNWEEDFRFSNNCIWFGSSKFSQSSIGCLPSALNLLRNISKISSNSTGDIFEINFSQKDENRW